MAACTIRRIRCAHATACAAGACCTRTVQATALRIAAAASSSSQPTRHELPKIDAIHRQGVRNGVEDLALISGTEAKQLEPELACVAALNSPRTGIIDSHAFMLALQGDVEDAGGAVAFGTRIESLAPTPAGWEVRFGGDETGSLTVDAVVNSAGLGATALARATHGYPATRIPRLVLAKGNYFGYAGRPVFSRLIYPAPVEGGLGNACDLRSRRAHAIRSRRRVDHVGKLWRGRCPRRLVLCQHSDLLAGTAGWLAGARLRRHSSQADRSGRAAGRFHDRGSARSTACRDWSTCSE